MAAWLTSQYGASAKPGIRDAEAHEDTSLRKLGECFFVSSLCKEGVLLQ